MELKVDVRYKLGELLYLKASGQRVVVVGYMVDLDSVMYRCSDGIGYCVHYYYELSKEKPIE